MTDTRHYLYVNAHESVMHGLHVGRNCTIDAGHDLPDGSTAVLQMGDVITVTGEQPYEHAWLLELDEDDWADAVDARRADLAELDEEPSAPAVVTVELPPDAPAEAPVAGKAKAAPKKAASKPAKSTDAAAPGDAATPPADSGNTETDDVGDQLPAE